MISALVISTAISTVACDDETTEPAGDDMAEEASETSADTPAELEECEATDVMRECDDGEGMQFCVANELFEWHWDECQVTYECLPGDIRDCGLGSTVTCRLDTDGVPYFPGCPFTPLVLRFEPGPVELASNAAPFDMDGAGMCLNTDWPASSNPWLVLDRDHNGFIDGGHELFGAGWVLDSGRRADDGFVALATLDSNADGRIDAKDAQFGELLVWRDDDGDKLSLPGELSSLADEGIEGIALDVGIDVQCDERQNCGRERSRFEFRASGQLRVGEVVDVHLPCR